MSDHPGWKGRGAADNPANRFELRVVEPDPEALDERSAPETQVLPDRARTILTRNDSPDVGFTWSLNPYRGCEHGCTYCMSGDTPVLMADGSTRPMAELRVGDAIYGTGRVGWYRRYTRTNVLAHWRTVKMAYRIVLGDGTELVSSGDHRFLTERGWKHVTGTMAGRARRPHLTLGNKLMGVGAFSSEPVFDEEYKRGYLCGMIRGDAHLATYHYDRVGGGGETLRQFRLALVDVEGLERTEEFLREFNVATSRFVFHKGTEHRKPLQAIRTQTKENIDRISLLIAWPAAPTDGWTKGFLAGLFDAEGGYNRGILRISNTDQGIIDATCRGLSHIGFTFAVEEQKRLGAKPVKVVRVTAGLREHLRFFHVTRPAISRKQNIEGQAVKSNADLRIVAIEPLNKDLELYDITTGTEDFIASGVVSHNCYARPYHEYLALSAGLDFETRLFVKEDAPELLRKELASPKWTPSVVALSGVTDAYQPIERRYQVTRRCLEVLAEFRNPVGVVTKNALVARDADLLADLARDEAALVMVSVTSLDPHLAGVMEPRASRPNARLAAIRALRNAGVPVGAAVAPIIPGLNDHEIPAILEAVAEAGARWAFYTIVRLPHGVGDLFADWLERHFPDRKDKVLGRVKEMRGGKVNDARFGVRMRGEGPLAEQIRALFKLSCRRVGLETKAATLSAAAFRSGRFTQGTLF